MTERLTIGIIVILLLQGCAKIGKPSGGPDDLNPPVYLSSFPENRSVNFNDDQINILFDEYIQLRDQNKEIIVSPPMAERPLVRVRDKGIRITFDEELLSETTYTINFGKSLSDINKNNELPDFEFVFSTGSKIDSLSITGKVNDAFTNKFDPKETMLIMLYTNLTDSAPFLEIPMYYGKTNQNGLFAVNNIRSDTFRVFALGDINNNLKYDQGLEKLAFLDTLFIINPENVVAQTFIKDTVKIVIPPEKRTRGSSRDTVQLADTVIAPGKKLNAISVSLYSFIEQSNKVFITSRNRGAENIVFTFNRPLFDRLKINPLNFKPDSQWYLPETSGNNDTLTYWITDSVIARRDTLILQLDYLTTDSTGLLVSKIDTVKLRTQAAKPQSNRESGGRRSKNEPAVIKKAGLALRSNIQNRGTINLNRSVVFTSGRPIHSVNTDSIEFFKLVDTVYKEQAFQYIIDTNSIRRFHLINKWEEETTYRILLKPGSVKDIYGLTNDTLKIDFKTQGEDYYGRILLNFNSNVYPMIVQLVDDRGAVLNSKISSADGILTFDYLSPGRYNLKAIHDRNGNGKWDTGDYLKHLQPEKVFLSGKTEQLRSNWDLELSWSITN